MQFTLVAVMTIMVALAGKSFAAPAVDASGLVARDDNMGLKLFVREYYPEVHDQYRRSEMRRSLERRAITRAQQAAIDTAQTALTNAQAHLKTVTDRRGGESSMTDAQKTQLRNDLVAAQTAVSTATTNLENAKKAAGA